MAFNILDRRGVIVVVEDDEGPHKTIEAASAASDKLVAEAVKSNLAEQDAMDAEAEAASAGEFDSYLSDLTSKGVDYIRDNYPKARAVEEAKARGLPYSGTEAVIIARILKDIEGS